MNPWIVLVGGCATCVLLPAVHGVINRLRGLASGFLFSVFFACAVTAAAVTMATPRLAGVAPDEAWETTAWQGALCTGLCACYAVTVVGLRETSPSVRILQLLRNAGPDGRALPDIIRALSDRSTVVERIVGAHALGIVHCVDDRVVLTPAGKLAARSLQLIKFMFYV